MYKAGPPALVTPALNNATSAALAIQDAKQVPDLTSAHPRASFREPYKPAQSSPAAPSAATLVYSTELDQGTVPVSDRVSIPEMNFMPSQVTLGRRIGGLVYR